MKKAHQICLHCGAKMVEHGHVLNAGLRTGLARLYRQSGIEFGRLDDLNLTYSQRCNFQKLGYLGLVEGNGERDGLWRVTDLGECFLVGEVMVERKAWTYRGKVVRREGPRVSMPSPLERRYRKRPEWAAKAVNHQEEGGTLPLFGGKT